MSRAADVGVAVSSSAEGDADERQRESYNTAQC